MSKGLNSNFRKSEKKRIRNIKKKLLEIEWDFHNSKNIRGLHDIHPYPAKFIPEIPRTLIKILNTPNNTAVLDPFCGSGVTLVEAQNNGLNSIGVDLNPIACMISRVKTTSSTSNLIRIAKKCVQNAKSKSNPTIPNIPNLAHWFEPEIQRAIAALLLEINNVKSEIIRERLRLALSSILVRVSKQESDTRYAAITKKTTYEKVFDGFILSCQNIQKNLINRVKLPKAIVLEKNILEVKPEDISLPIGLVITSPPYPNAYEYWLYHKYRMWWLGFDPLKVKEKEIGARAHFFKKNHHTEKDFQKQMDQTFSLLDQITVPKAFVCFVIGRSLIHGKIVDNTSIVISAAVNHGFEHFITLNRKINRNRKSFNLSHARIIMEDIIILQKKIPGNCP